MPFPPETQQANPLSTLLKLFSYPILLTDALPLDSHCFDCLLLSGSYWLSQILPAVRTLKKDDLEPTCLKFPRIVLVLYAADLATRLLAHVKWKVCSTLKIFIQGYIVQTFEISTVLPPSAVTCWSLSSWQALDYFLSSQMDVDGVQLRSSSSTSSRPSLKRLIHL